MSSNRNSNTPANLWRILQNKYQKKVCPAPHSIWTNPIHFIACGFGVGAFPILPGTMGTLVAIPLAVILGKLSLIYNIISCALLFIIGVMVCQITNRDFGTEDHPAAVIDEIATFPVSLIAIPHTFSFVLAAFVLFRFFDIVKPGPIRWVDKNVHGGIGVMLDDLLAAIATLVILHFTTWILGITV